MKLLDEKAPAFGIKNLKMVSFSAQRGYGYKYTATDVAVAVNAILELSGRKDPELNFHTGTLSFVLRYLNFIYPTMRTPLKKFYSREMTHD